MQKKWVIGITAMSLVATTAIGSTLAYFTTKTQQMNNTFTVAAPNGVTAQLREPGWDGLDFILPFGVPEPNGQFSNPWMMNDRFSETPTLGINQAARMMPGAAISKDPKMKNTTNCDLWGNRIGFMPNVPVYMAMKVDTVNINNATPNIDPSGKSGWKKLDNKLYKFNKTKEVGDIYLWCGSSKKLDAVKGLKPAEVQSGGQTNALFDTVTINPKAIQNSSVTTKPDNATLELKNFEIQVQGAAVQSANLNKLYDIESQLVGELGATMN